MFAKSCWGPKPLSKTNFPQAGVALTYPPSCVTGDILDKLFAKPVMARSVCFWLLAEAMGPPLEVSPLGILMGRTIVVKL